MLLSNTFLETLWASKDEYSCELGPQNGAQNQRKIKLREKVKIELSPGRELYFRCLDPPKIGTKNHLKNDLATDPLKNTVRKALFTNLVPTCPKSGPNSGPWGRPANLFFQFLKLSWEQMAPGAPQGLLKSPPRAPQERQNQHF